MRMRRSGEDEGKLPFREGGRERIMICKIFGKVERSFVIGSLLNMDIKTYSGQRGQVKTPCSVLRMMQK